MFLDYELLATERNRFGSKDNMESGNLLMLYSYVINDLKLKEDQFQDDTYVSVLSNLDFRNMYKKSMNIYQHELNRLKR